MSTALDTITDTDLDSLKAKLDMMQKLAELYNAMVDVALDIPIRPNYASYDFVKAEAKRRIALGIVKHSYLECMEDQPDVEELDG